MSDSIKEWYEKGAREAYEREASLKYEAQRAAAAVQKGPGGVMEDFPMLDRLDALDDRLDARARALADGNTETPRERAEEAEQTVVQLREEVARLSADAEQLPHVKREVAKLKVENGQLDRAFKFWQRRSDAFRDGLAALATAIDTTRFGVLDPSVRAALVRPLDGLSFVKAVGLQLQEGDEVEIAARVVSRVVKVEHRMRFGREGDR